MTSSPAAAKASPTPKKGEDEADGVFARLSELAWQALPALGSAAGFVGFVAVIGAAIEWVRFRAAHLPATQAVLVVPKHELVVIGALTLAVFVAGGAMAVLLVYLIDNRGDATVGTVWGIVMVGVIEVIVTLFFVDLGECWFFIYWGIFFVSVGAAMADTAGEATQYFRERGELKRARDNVLAARDRFATVGDAGGGPEPNGPDGSRGARLRQRVGRAVRRRQRQVRGRTPQGTDGEEHLARRAWQRAIREWKQTISDVERRAIWGASGRDRRTGEQNPPLSVSSREGRSPHKGERKPPDGPAAEAAEKVAAFATYDEPPASLHLKQCMSAAEEQLPSGWRIVGRTARGTLGDGIKWFGSLLGHIPMVLAGFAVGALVSAIGVGTVFVVKDGSTAWVAAMSGVVALLAMMNVFAARATTKFAWYGVSVFFSVLLFGAAFTFARTLRDPKVQPIALIRKSDDTGVCGVYITETGSRVYIGRLALSNRRPGLIFSIPSSDVELVSIGELVNVHGVEAGNEHERADDKPAEAKEPHDRPAKASPEAFALAMLAQLYRDRAEEAAASLKNTTTTTVEGPEKVSESASGASAPSAAPAASAGTAATQSEEGVRTTTTARETPPAETSPKLHPAPPGAMPTTCAERRVR